MAHQRVHGLRGQRTQHPKGPRPTKPLDQEGQAGQKRLHLTGPQHRASPLHQPKSQDWSDRMDWTGTRMSVTSGIGTLTLTPALVGPYLDGHEGVVSFVRRYAEGTLERMGLSRVVIQSASGDVLGEVSPPASKMPF